jgi:hypothetical protein
MSTMPQTGACVVESSTAEYDRLVGVPHTFHEHVQDGCGRAGLRRGDRVIDGGCGPLGALLSLADLVGPTGSVVGQLVKPGWRILVQDKVFGSADVPPATPVARRRALGCSWPKSLSCAAYRRRVERALIAVVGRAGRPW